MCFRQKIPVNRAFPITTQWKKRFVSDGLTAGSPSSQPNIERLIWLHAHGLIHPKVEESILPVIRTRFVFPPDIIDTLRQDQTVWENYEQFSDPYKRIRVAYIEAARNRPDEFQKRLNSFIDKTRRNKLIMGYGGIDKYYG